MASFPELDKEQYIKVVLCEPGKKARVTTILNTLESLQHIVGDSCIECAYPFEDPVTIVCDEGSLILDIIAGPFMVVGLSDDDFASLLKKHQEKYTKMFEQSKIFCRVGEEIQAVPINTPERTQATKHR